MGLFKSVNTVKKLREKIYTAQKQLRNSPQFSTIFYKLIQDPAHPPRYIEATQSGEFWTEAWLGNYNAYEPYKTLKFTDPSFGYAEGCALYLLIQECYPSVYEFPDNTVREIEGGATIKLIMRESCAGLPLRPIQAPPMSQAFSAVTSSVSASVGTPAPATGKFCTQCGAQNAPEARFCQSCGNRL